MDPNQAQCCRWCLRVGHWCLGPPLWFSFRRDGSGQTRQKHVKCHRLELMLSVDTFLWVYKQTGENRYGGKEKVRDK